MASRSLGTLTVDLVAKTGGFEAGMDKAARTADRRMKEIQRTATQMGTILGTALAAGAGIAAAAIIASTKAAIDNADAIRDMSIRLGTATETLSAYGYAAGQTGTDLDTLGRGLKILAKNAADSLNPTSEQAKVFEALGVSALDAEGKLKDLSVLVPDIANKFAQLEDGTTKAALAQALFGKAGLELTEFLNSGADGLAEMAQRAAELGIVIDGETAAAADQFNDTLGELKAILSGVGLEIARGLLPALNDGASSLRDMALEGDLAENAVTLLSAALRAGIGVLETYNRAVAVTSAAIETIVNASEGLAEIQRNIGFGGLNDGSMAAGAEKVRDAFREGDKALASIQNRSKNLFSGVQSSVRGPQSTDSGLERRLGIALSNPTAKKAGKSDAEREAESLQKAYDSLMESMKERIALFNTEGEAAKVAYDLEFGSLSALTDAQKANALALAEQYDQMVKVREEGEARAQMAKEETDRINEGLAAGKELVADLQFELELMRMTNAERAVAIQLRGLEAEAVAEYGDQIVALNQKIEEAIKADEFWQDFQSSMSDAFYDFATGAKSAEDALGDFLDAIYSSSVKAAADYFSETISNMFKGTSGSGSSGGGGWAALIGAIFGGGRASGGWTSPNTIYEVNERGMEMASVNGRDYLLTGNSPVEITPNHRLGSGGGITQQFYTMGRETRETSERKALVAGREAQRALARTG